MVQTKIKYLYTTNGQFTNNNIYTVYYWGDLDPIVLDDNNWLSAATNFTNVPGRWSIESLVVTEPVVII